MTQAFIGIGSNINPSENVREALLLLNKQVRIRAISTVYRTEPIGPPGQSPYYNCVISVETERTPVDLKRRVLRPIEAALKRERTGNTYASRTIDLDLILYNALVMTTEELTLPAPDIVHRPFLAIPLQELAPGLVLPGSGLRIDEAASKLPQDTMKALAGYTELIRKEILHERTQ